VYAFIADHLEEDFGFETLSRETGVDRFQLCRGFRHAFGLPPFRFRRHLRVARARQFLAAGYDCSYAAHAAGFCDQSHLSRSFKLLTATTPGSYLRACRPAAASVEQTAACFGFELRE
jgi:AraC-like DNA-binding protein